MGIPVVISENGFGLPVKQVDDGACVMTVAENGFGIPIVLSDRGVPFVVQGGGTPTPTMTTSNAFSQDEDLVMAKTVSFSGPVSPVIGGDDAMFVELIGTYPGTDFTLRWFGDGTQDYTFVNDFNTDHIYTFTLSWAGGGFATINVTLNQVIPAAANAFDASTKNAGITLSLSNTRATNTAGIGYQMVRVDKGLAHTATAYFEMTVTTAMTGSGALYAGVLLSSATNTQRVGRDSGAGADFGSYGWETWAGGAQTGSNYAGDFSTNGDVWRFEMSGGLLTCKLNGVQKGPTQTIPTGTVYPAVTFDSPATEVGVVTYSGTGWV